MKERSHLLVVLAWFVAVAIASLLPTSVKSALHTEGQFHSWDHLFVFALGGVILLRVTAQRAGQIGLLVCGLATGYCLELAEHLVYHNDVELKDMLMDTLGVGVGALIMFLWNRNYLHRWRNLVLAKWVGRGNFPRSGR